jgi:hypothetical protein
MIEYYYHPILGLQYSYHEPILVIDMCEIPEEVTLGEFISNWKNLTMSHGIEFTDAITQLPTKIISNK